MNDVRDELISLKEDIFIASCIAAGIQKLTAKTDSKFDEVALGDLSLGLETLLGRWTTENQIDDLINEIEEKIK